ncbi:MAG TPA: 30S ribosomal protein S16 [Candidatus Krumholzibacterium sp.]|nr:30S ribosomal protein S16 [Candidatus Krumholzibacterium sp.]
MAVKIRMKKMGSKKRPFFRIIAADERCPRDGRFIETLGHYNPLTEPAEINIDEDKLYKWLDRGAKPTDNTMNLLKKLHLIERWQLLKSGVTVAELDGRVEELRAKQPKPKEKSKEKLSKKAVAAAAKAEEEKAKAAEEAAKAAAEEAAKEAEPEAEAVEETPEAEEPKAGE